RAGRVRLERRLRGDQAGARAGPIGFTTAGRPQAAGPPGAGDRGRPVAGGRRGLAGRPAAPGATRWGVPAAGTAKEAQHRRRRSLELVSRAVLKRVLTR